MTTIEELINTILQLKEVAEKALELASKSEATDQLRKNLQEILDDHHSRD